MTTERIITNAVVVLPDRVVDRAAVRIAGERIVEVVDGPSRTTGPGIVDAAGGYLIPGVVDLHNDALEFEIHPRASAMMPLPFALANMERRLAAAGVTTGFHALVFMEEVRKGRTVADAVRAADYLATLDGATDRAVRHQILHRLDVWTPGVLELALRTLRRVALPYVSLNDHTPGQGQYHDVERLLSMAGAATGTGQMSDPETYLRRLEEGRARGDAIPPFYTDVAAVRAELPLVISTHDDDTVAKVDAQHAIGATVAEFPTTMKAARRLRDLGMTIVVGAPNIVRGGSQSGNLSATDLVGAGLADVICADYHAPSLVPAAFRLVDERLCDLPAAIAMLTRNAARAVGMSDRGEIAPGQLADLALVRRDASGWPHVERTWLGGRDAFAFVPPATALPALPV
ncbi:MAG TPA: alpha-D-ribose 1-methylphosphonate 5-triphosphate diphosphatase [Thermomicrobiales bacterium]|nr:alpha-D-ribose 1-methylphosphonate 5-triphosphate diphosphatase [Thermomicrobiales bacterium]